MMRLFVLILLAVPTVAAADCIELIEFEIEDQFKEKHTRDELLGEATMIIWADRKGSDYTGAWSEALEAALEGYDVRDIAMAHVKGVPGWIPGLKGKIRGSFSEDPAEWALLDWDGKFAKAYSLVDDMVNILVFSAEGCLLGRVAGSGPDPVLIDALLEFVPGPAGTE